MPLGWASKCEVAHQVLAENPRQDPRHWRNMLEEQETTIERLGVYGGAAE